MSGAVKTTKKAVGLGGGSPAVAPEPEAPAPATKPALAPEAAASAAPAPAPAPALAPEAAPIVVNRLRFVGEAGDIARSGNQADKLGLPKRRVASRELLG
jgi:hypothetical protein